MLQPVVRWMRVVLPRGELLVIAVMLIVVLEILQASLAHRMNQPELFSRARLFVLALISLQYGCLRAVSFHPACDADYERWLQFTPWTAQRPLPAGPLTLVPQDLAVMAIFVGLHHEFTLSLLYLPVAFLFGYLITMCYLNRMVGEWGLAYSSAFVVAGIPLLYPRLEYVLALEIVAYILTYWGVQRGLRRFPWDLPELYRSMTSKAVAEQLKERRLGWPYDVVSLAAPKLLVPLSDGLCLSLLVGWLEFTLLVYFNANGLIGNKDHAISSCIVLSAFLAIIRYFEFHRSPISFFGRMFTLRWWIPGFDLVWLVPLFSGCVALVAHVLLPTYWKWVPLTAHLLVILVAAPRLERWRLIGNHRAQFTWSAQTSAKDFVELG